MFRFWYQQISNCCEQTVIQQLTLVPSVMTEWSLMLCKVILQRHYSLLCCSRCTTVSHSAGYSARELWIYLFISEL